jgi:hypothetical protein
MRHGIYCYRFDKQYIKIFSYVFMLNSIIIDSL